MTAAMAQPAFQLGQFVTQGPSTVGSSSLRITCSRVTTNQFTSLFRTYKKWAHRPTPVSSRLLGEAPNRAACETSQKRNSPMRGYSYQCGGSGGRIRTCDLRVMSPTSCQTAPPRIRSRQS